jgi:rhodanese-related sulfurtransferase
MDKQFDFYQSKLDFEMDSSDLFTALENGEKVLPLDTRQTFGYDKEHIPRAINLPHRQMDENTTKHLDKEITYICYCDGIGCNASTKGALKMSKLGFNVRELIGGLEWWKSEGYATEGAESSKGLTIKCAC